MRGVSLFSSIQPAGARLKVLALGAHSDDVEIGAGGSLLTWSRLHNFDMHWCVLSGAGDRAKEAEASAHDFVSERAALVFESARFRDGFFPQDSAALKEWFRDLARRVVPDIILTHARDDAHQDHREVNRLTWSEFRNHLILEYEIPKWDGDLGQPSVYQPLCAEMQSKKVDLLMKHFATQRSKDWFDRRVFDGLARLRGMECRAPDGFAEAFHARKIVIG